MPGGGIEEAEALERRQGVHGRGGRAAPTSHGNRNCISMTKSFLPWMPGSMLVVLRRNVRHAGRRSRARGDGRTPTGIMHYAYDIEPMCLQ